MDMARGADSFLVSSQTPSRIGAVGPGDAALDGGVSGAGPARLMTGHAEWLAELSAAVDVADVATHASERLVAMFASAAGGVIQDGEVLGAAGPRVGALAARHARLLALAAAGDERTPLAGLGCVSAASVQAGGVATTLFVVDGRTTPSDEQARDALRGMAAAVAFVLRVVKVSEARRETARGERRRAAHTLYRGEQRLHEILDGAADAFMSIDAEGLIVDWNAEAHQTFGWTAGEALGRHHAETLIAPARRPDGSGLLDGDEWPLAEPVKLRARHRDGHEFPAEVTLSRIPAGDSFLFHAFVRDVSRREQSEKNRRDAEEKLAYQALHDALTGLANRTLLLDRLRHALGLAQRRERGIALLFVDLDEFKLVNETLGHHAGDAVLVTVAQRLRDVVRASETVARVGQNTLARIGGDEFVLVCEDIETDADAVGIAERIAAALAVPFQTCGETIRPSASIGIALASATDSAESLLRDAGAAIHRAKERGGARYELFDETIRARVFDRRQREHELRAAIEGRQLRLVYQPIVSLPGRQLVAAEALVRWQHPERGLLAPAEFLPLAEETGLIIPLGRWVLETACAQIKSWQAGAHGGPAVRVSVNVSAHQLLHGQAVTLVSDLLAQTGLDPACLAVEITETVLMQEGQAPVDILRDLQALGVQIFLDDFGTGYSSLSYLHTLPLDAIKLDRSFLTGITESPARQEIVASVLQMARALELHVVAEGIETASHLMCLQDLGCLLAQGYYFARPMPAEQLTPLLGRPFGVTAPG
jgi:diguanylate cyclase (GGDEF)-like protein/PAS domain S-box-containing protein